MSDFQFGVLVVLIIAVGAQFQSVMRKLRDIEEKLGGLRVGVRKLETLRDEIRSDIKHAIEMHELGLPQELRSLREEIRSDLRFEIESHETRTGN
jgi:hypothetical protein